MKPPSKCLLLIPLAFASCERDSGEESNSATVYSGPLFESLKPEDTGVNFTNIVPEDSHINVVLYRYLHNGAGVALGDINDDGLVDIYFTANFGDNKLFLNKGNMQFEDISKKAGVTGAWGWSNGVTMADVNGDGMLDIYVSRAGDMGPEKRKNELFINLGNLAFSEQAENYGLADSAYSTQAAFFDYDRDGDLDMYLLNHPIDTQSDEDYVTPSKDTTDKLFRNENSKFVDVSIEAGLRRNGIGYGLSVSTGDLNNDGWPDLYVSNDYIERDYLYYNNQDGTFRESIREGTMHISNFSMGSDIADFNNDGLLDVVVVDMVAEDNYRIKTNMSGMNPEKFEKAVNDGFHYQYMSNTLQMNNGNGTFSDVSRLAGISNTDWSWAPLFADFDNDGFSDLLITNGLRKDSRNSDFVKRKRELMEEMERNPEKKMDYVMQMLREMPVERVKNYIYKNEGDFTFSNRIDEWGLSEPSHSNGASYADLDNDGDLDMVISNVDQPAFIYENKSDQVEGRNFLKIKLHGPGLNTSGLGARISIKTGSGIQMKEHYLSRGYLSSVEDAVHFGIGSHRGVEAVWVQWPDGSTQMMTEVAANSNLSIEYEKGGVEQFPDPATAEVLFSPDGASALGVNHVHEENEYDDFAKETLLPHKLSNLGPDMAVGDVNGDGLDDFHVGGAKGFSGVIYLQGSDGKFRKQEIEALSLDARHEDVSSVFFDADGDGDQDLYVVSGGSEFEPNSEGLQDRLYLNDGSCGFERARDALPMMLTSGGCVAVGDFDDDGDPDVFVGGRLVPGAYPKAPRSYLLENNGGSFRDATEERAPELLSPGLVTSCMWVDVDDDRDEDLIVAGEWMPILVLRNQDGSFKNISGTLGLMDQTGWWYSMATGDLDNDGDDDFVFGNLGLNYKYKASSEAPFEVYYDDFDDNNTGDIVLSYDENGKKVPLRGRECSSQQMPFIKEKFPTYDAFARAGLIDIFGDEKLEGSLHLSATTFASIWVENKLDQPWVVHALPNRAQLSSNNGIVIRDINGDGFLDMVLAGNLFESEVETPRNDAGKGLVLTGDGAGGLQPLSVLESGLYAPGNVKNLNLVEVQGKTYLAVLNNSGPIQLFECVGGADK